ncbi:MAG: nucleotidyltransferase family protein [Janthinobacterium lividum]
MAPSAETTLMLACCRPVRAPDRVSAIRQAGEHPFDPATLLTHARNHRVEGFVLQGLTAAGIPLPDRQAALLDDRARRARMQMLRNAAEEVRVTRALRDAGVDPVSLKGSSLAMLAHGTLALKTTWDIDLLVHPAARAAAEAVLVALGYRAQVMDGRRSPREIERHAVSIKEMAWHHPGRDTTVELHRALFDDRRLLPAIGTGSARAAVDLPGAGTVGTLAAGPLFAYLTVHGALHGWMRVKWLADLAGLIDARDDAVEDWYRAAVAAGAGRAPAVALSLSSRLLGTRLPESVRREAARDRGVARFVTVAETLIDGWSDETEGCCQSNANRSPHDAVRALRRRLSSRATATPPKRRSVVPCRSGGRRGGVRG